MPFWRTLQNGFLECQGERPMLRAKMVNLKRKQLAQQLMGQLSSLIVLDSDFTATGCRLEEHLPLVTECAELIGMDDDVLSEKVRRKQGRYLKAVQKFKETEAERKARGLPMRKPQEGGAA